jgi:hypothetical protein
MDEDEDGYEFSQIEAPDLNAPPDLSMMAIAQFRAYLDPEDLQDGDLSDLCTVVGVAQKNVSVLAGDDPDYVFIAMVESDGTIWPKAVNMVRKISVEINP